MFYIFVLFTLALTLIFQILMPMYLTFGIIPEFALISVIFFAFKYGSLFGELYGFICGIMVDTLTVHVFGLRALLFTITGYSVGVFSKKLDESKPEVQVLVVFISLLAYYISDTIFIKSENATFNFFRFTLGIIFNCILTPFVFMALNIWFGKVKKWFGKASL